MAPWKLPFALAAIAVPIVAAFYVSPGLGLAAGAVMAAGIVVVAARLRPRDPIGAEGRSRTARGRLLLVVSRPIEEEAALEQIAEATRAGAGAAGPAEVLALAPARIGFLDRWASDVEAARREAQKRLVITVASLARVGIAAEARVGDEDPVQAVEDQLGSFPATEVILVTGPPGEDAEGDAAAADLQQRLRTAFRRVIVSYPAAR